MDINNALLINFTTIFITLDDVNGLNTKKILVRNGDLLMEFSSVKHLDNRVELILKTEINIKKESIVFYEGCNCSVNYYPLYSTAEFDERYYTEDTLGCSYSNNGTIFKLWSPIAAYVDLLLYKNGDPSIKEVPKRYKMIENQGLWSTNIQDSLKGYFYTFEVKAHNTVYETTDPYAKAVGINGYRGAVVNLRDSDPSSFSEEISPRCENFTDAVIYEASIRDISVHPDSGIENKGRFKGLIEEGTVSSKGLSTGLSHLKELGITHLQLLPVFDFSPLSTDEKHPFKYNWGYDPFNYNVPEGSYSTDPYDPLSRILEFKSLVQELHENNICIIMDVVYNHMSHSTENNLHKSFPGYYFRQWENGELCNGSGCGNDTASERSMMRKFIIDSVVYWAKEYHIDGFRLDLMGLHDIDTVNKLRRALDKIDEKIMLYGEGWELNTDLKAHEKATISNANNLPKIGHFNDIIRDTIKGSVFDATDRGFISGKEALEGVMRFCTTACTQNTGGKNPIFTSPVQSINYASAHDNYTLHDKLMLSCSGSSEKDLEAMTKLSAAIILTSQGIPFIHAGEEFCRTKSGVENSYNCTDEINRLDWRRKFQYYKVFKYYQGLIELRKTHSAFRMKTGEEIENHLQFIENTPPHVVGFILKNGANHDPWRDIVVIYNGAKWPAVVTLPQASWTVVVDGNNSGTVPLYTLEGGSVTVQPISAIVLFRE
jgi:pullulanase